MAFISMSCLLPQDGVALVDGASGFFPAQELHQIGPQPIMNTTIPKELLGKSDTVKRLELLFMLTMMLIWLSERTLIIIAPSMRLSLEVGATADPSSEMEIRAVSWLFTKEKFLEACKPLKSLSSIGQTDQY